MLSPCFNDTSIHLIEGARTGHSSATHGGHDGEDSSGGNRAGTGWNRHFARKPRGADSPADRVCMGPGPGAGGRRRDGGGIRTGSRKRGSRKSRAEVVFRLRSSGFRLKQQRGKPLFAVSPFVVKRPTSS